MHGSDGASVSDELCTVRQGDDPACLIVVGSKP